MIKNPLARAIKKALDHSFRIEFVTVTFFILVCLVIFSASTVFAQASDFRRVESKVPTPIRAHDICKRVLNENNQALFVPTRTPNEWFLFRNISNRSDIKMTDCYSWSLGEWQSCSGSANVYIGQWGPCEITSSNGCRGSMRRPVNCSPGQGQQIRQIQCVNEQGGAVSDAECLEAKPATTQSCTVTCEVRYGVFYVNNRPIPTTQNCSICGGGSKGDR